MRIFKVGLFLVLLMVPYIESCNEMKCASIVSKCQLAESCNCKTGDFKCYKKCRNCLGSQYYDDCCDCLELCKKPKKEHFSLSERSHVEEFEGLSELFNALVADPIDDEDNNWKQLTYQQEINKHNLHPNLIKNGKNSQISNEVIPDDLLYINCTVIYLNECVSWNKCRHSCRAIGSSSYRWFHDGCCECAGPTCLNYGLNESRCKYCPYPDDIDDFEDDDDDDDDGDINNDINEDEDNNINHID